MAMSMEQKLAKQFTDAMCDTRFSPMLFAQIIATGEPYVHRQVVQAFIWLCDLISINYDYGNFGEADLPYLRLCKQISTLMAEHEED